MDKSKEFNDFLNTDKSCTGTFNKMLISKSIVPELSSIIDSVFTECVFTECVFTATFFNKCIFINCIFINCKFIGCVLEYTEFRSCDFMDFEMRGCKILKAIFEYCEYSGDIINCDFSHFNNIRGLSTNNGFTKCIISEHTLIDYNSFEFKSTRVIKEGDIVVYKKAISPERASRVIVELLIPKEAKRSQAFSNKCRAEFAIVKSIRTIGGGETLDLERAVSFHASQLNYRVGETVRPEEPFDEDWKVECTSGIHFFMTEEEALNYF